MSCTSLRGDILSALRSQSEGNIQKARVNIEVYLHHPVGIGEHPDIIAAIQDQLDIIAHEEERIAIIDKHFTSHHHN